ncbi:MAG TPA: hypothetical protein VEW25_06820 [Allosphingosinicella sp.]|nr:hypothetical protein [Allosphingosinicella sp.]
MSGARPEDLIVGLICLALLPAIAIRIVRGVRDGRLPIYRTYLGREESRARFTVLLALHALSFVLVAIIAADLLLNLGFRERL